MLLVGAAAGFAYSQSGEGIRPAVESGLMAALAILAADGYYDHGRLDMYAMQLTVSVARGWVQERALVIAGWRAAWPLRDLSIRLIIVL